MYRQKDIEVVSLNLDKLEDQAKLIYLNSYEPTLVEIKNVYNEIKQFIKDKNRIVYGGYAQNELIRAKNKDDVFYRDVDVADIEFYTTDPLGDMIDLCDLLYRKKYKYIDGKEGVHNETYKVFVNFINYCDITYIPPEIYNNIPTITVSGLRMCHPHFMLIDSYRVYTDPMTAYFRLKKTFIRFTKLISYYPFDENMVYNKINYDDKEKTDVLNFIKNKILKSSNLIVVGQYGFNRLMKKANMPDTYYIPVHYFQVISTNYSKDIDSIHNILRKQFPSITKKTFYPFSQFLDKSSEWYIDNTLVLRIYGNYDRCTVFHKSHKKIKFGTYQLIFMYALIHYIMNIKKNKFNEVQYCTMISRLIKARDKYLDKHEKTVLDKTPFQEFTMKCIGEPKDILRSSFIDKQEKRDAGKRATFLYKPKGSHGKKPIFKFDNTSGTKT